MCKIRWNKAKRALAHTLYAIPEYCTFVFCDIFISLRKKMGFFKCFIVRELGDESFVQLIQAVVQIGAIEIVPS